MSSRRLITVIKKKYTFKFETLILTWIKKLYSIENINIDKKNNK